MPYDVRVRIFAGISVAIGGLVFGTVAPVVIALVWLPDLDPATLESELANSTMRLGDIAAWSTKTAIVGWTIAVAACCYAYFVWARWFLGRERVAARLET